MKTKYASLTVPGIEKNQIFDPDYFGNRDDSFYPYRRLREVFLEAGVELNTSDVNQGREVLFEIDMNIQPQGGRGARYGLLLEPVQIEPLNGSAQMIEQYRKVFTWNDLLVDGKRVVHLCLPNKPGNGFEFGFKNREALCCLIAGNKAAKHTDEQDLYSQRVKTIRWFEAHAPNDFNLYGTRWDCPPARSGLVGRLFSRVVNPVYRRLSLKPFPSYGGPVKSKQDALSRHKFSICYENTRQVGYITEKIFDCFFSGCVPVYWGAPNVEDYIPANCFVDRAAFSSHEDLYQVLVNMTEDRYISYQRSILTFLESDEAQIFYAEHFAKTVANTILGDLEYIA